MAEFYATTIFLSSKQIVSYDIIHVIKCVGFTYFFK